ncbi:GNAT family N-acetyltransferase [Nostoc sp.]|uniref:GNAT family N-acetyltransferase n=1 Tax=Nostoc sp. TaxID=1180 RepID=UPI002FFBA843
MNSNELPQRCPQGIEIKKGSKHDYKESLGDDSNPDDYTYYNIYFEGKKVGNASYRYNNSYACWQIDRFLIYEDEEGNGYGSCLLKYISQEMWSIKRSHIKISPTKKEEFISWLIRRGFKETQVPGFPTTFYVLQPG